MKKKIAALTATVLVPLSLVFAQTNPQQERKSGLALLFDTFNNLNNQSPDMAGTYAAYLHSTMVKARAALDGTPEAKDLIAQIEQAEKDFTTLPEEEKIHKSEQLGRQLEEFLKSNSQESDLGILDEEPDEKQKRGFGKLNLKDIQKKIKEQAQGVREAINAGKDRNQAVQKFRDALDGGIIVLDEFKEIMLSLGADQAQLDDELSAQNIQDGEAIAKQYGITDAEDIKKLAYVAQYLDEGNPETRTVLNIAAESTLAPK